MIILAIYSIIACFGCYYTGRSIGRRNGYDAGWVDRGLDDWRADMARRNRSGQFNGAKK